MKFTFTFLIFFVLNIGFTQNNWVNVLELELFDASEMMIETEDNGSLALSNLRTGPSLIKFSETGEIEWQRGYTFGNLPTSRAYSLVGSDSNYYLSIKHSSTDTTSSLHKLDLSGEIITSYYETNNEFFDVFTNLLVDSSGNLYGFRNEFWISNDNFLSKFDQDLNLTWTIDLSFLDDPILDNHSFIDDEDNIHFWMKSASSNSEAIRMVIDSEGNTLVMDNFPLLQSSFGAGILQGQLNDEKAVYVTDGGNINGTSRTLVLVDLETKTQLKSIELAETFFWINDLAIGNENIYIVGQTYEGGIWSELMILDEALNVKDKISLKNLIPESPVILGSSISEIKIMEQGDLLLSGYISGDNPMSFEHSPIGLLNMRLDENGRIDGVSSTVEKENIRLQVYPNPCINQLIINAETNSFSDLQIYNALGQLVYSELNGDLPLQLETSKFKDGHYFLFLNTGKEKVKYPFIKL